MLSIKDSLSYHGGLDGSDAEEIDAHRVQLALHPLSDHERLDTRCDGGLPRKTG